MSAQVPRGVEVLVKKAAVDPEFKELLLAERAAAALRIGLTLQPAESAMLAAISAEQLQTIVARTTVPQEHRRTFLGQAAAAMLAAFGGVGAATVGCSKGSRPEQKTTGSRPDRPPSKESKTLPQGLVPSRWNFAAAINV